MSLLDPVPHPLFDTYAALGFDTGDAPHQRCRFLFVRERGDRPVAWEPSGMRWVKDPIPGSGRVLRQYNGYGNLRLTTRCMFASREDFLRFYRQAPYPGTLRMNARYNVWPGRERQDVGDLVVVEWDDVVVDEGPRDITYDLRGTVHCTVTWERGDPSWTS